MNGNGRQTMVIFHRRTEVDSRTTDRLSHGQTVYLMDVFRRRTIRNIKCGRKWTAEPSVSFFGSYETCYGKVCRLSGVD